MKKTVNVLVVLLILCLVMVLTLNVLFIAAIIPGQNGPKGDKGEQGIQGIQGEKGDNGDSAYDIWLQDNPGGTKEEFLDWIKGKVGEQGSQGEQGEQGPQGEQGEKGDRGTLWFYGSSEPDLAGLKDAQDGDFYMLVHSDFSDLNGYVIYVKANGAWVKLVDMSVEKSDDEPLNEYHVRSLGDLVAFRDSVNDGNTYQGKTIYLDADLDLSSIDNWEPIGTAKTLAFAGTFKGAGENGHTISNLTIIEPENTPAGSEAVHYGLFGWTTNGAKFQNFTIENVTIDTPICRYVGAVAGGALVSITVDHVNVIGEISISGFWYVGGLVGNRYGTISDCRVEQTSGTGLSVSYQKAGGIIGQLQQGKVTNCYVKADIRGARNFSVCYATLGGLIGGMSSESPSYVTDNEIHVTIDSSIADTYNGTDYGIFTGALIGNPGGRATPCEISGNKGEAIITTNNIAFRNDGLAGAGDAPSISNNNVAVTWDGLVIKGTKEYEVGTAQGLATFASMVNAGNKFKGYTITLTQDIDLNDLVTVSTLDNDDTPVTNWTPIGTDEHPFEGIFDGDGKTISNLTIVDKTRNNVALFGRTNDKAEIRNFTLKNVTLVGNHYVAAVVGNAYTTKIIENVVVENAKISGTHWVAGIVGSIYGNVDKCRVSAFEIVCSVEDTGSGFDNGDKVGGIVGQLQDSSGYKVTNCTVEEGTITAYRDLGGIVGCAADAQPYVVTNNTLKNVTLTIDRSQTYGNGQQAKNVDYFVGRKNTSKGADFETGNTQVGCTIVGND